MALWRELRVLDRVSGQCPGEGCTPLAEEEEWLPAVELDGSHRPGAWVTELTGLVDLSSWGAGIRLLCRRERPHPGVQLSLFDVGEDFRHTCVLTNTSGGEIAALELGHRGHARVEDRVRNWKSCGLQNLPFDDVVRNATWLQVTLVAGALLSWSQLVCFDGALAKAEPKTLRYRILHIAALLVRRGRRLILRIDQTWPWAKDLERAFTRIRTAFG